MTTLETRTEIVEIPTTDTFVERLFGSVLAALDLQAVYLGDRLGYYRALAEGALTSTELAACTGTAERYVREWLEQQAVTGILVTDDRVADALARRYTLPAPYIAPLTDALDLSHFAPFVRFVVGSLKQTELMVGGVPHRRRGELGPARRGPPRGPGGGEPATVPRPAGPGVPAVDPGRGQRATRRRAGGRRGVRVGLVGDRYRAGVSGRHGGRLRRRRSVDRGGAPQRPRGRGRRPRAVPRRGRRGHADTVDGESYDAVFAFECIHDLADPVGVLAAMRRLAGDGGTVVVMDERVAETFTAPGDDVERLMYGYSLVCCLADGMAHGPSAGTGTVMRPSTLRRYAVEAGFADVEILDIANDFFRFYRLR